MRENVSSGPGQQQDGEERTDFVTRPEAGTGPRPSGTAGLRPRRQAQAPRQGVPRRVGLGAPAVCTAQRCPALGTGQAPRRQERRAERLRHLGWEAEPRAALGKGRSRGQRGDPGNGRRGAFGASEGQDVPEWLRLPPCVYYRKWDIRNCVNSTAKA